MDIPPQNAFLYQGKWSPMIDNILIDTIMKLKGETKCTLDAFPSWFMMTATRRIESDTGVVCSEVELMERVDVLRTHYFTFRSLGRRRDAHWEQSTKSIIADDRVWEIILKVCNLFPFT